MSGLKVEQKQSLSRAEAAKLVADLAEGLRGDGEVTLTLGGGTVELTVGPQVRCELEVETEGTPTATSALLRLVYSLPALFILAVLSFAAGALWVIGAIAILLTQRMPHAIAAFFALMLRYQFRLAAYHLSLVGRYPSFAEAATRVPHSGAA